MEPHLIAIRTAVSHLDRAETHQRTQAHSELVQALCKAMSAQVPPADAAAAANMSLGEMFNALRRDCSEAPIG